MKIIIKREILIQALSLVSPILQKTNETILSSSLFEAKDNKLYIKATNYEVSFCGSFPATIEKEGHICLDAIKLLTIAKNTQEEEITIHKKENNWVDVEYTNGSFKLSGIDANDYPEIVFDTLENNFTLSSDQIKQTIDQLFFAISDNEARRNLMGLNLRIQDGKLHWTSADSFRVGYTHFPIEENNVQEASIIIPRKSLVDMKRILATITSDVQISFDENSFQIEVDDIYFKSKLINGEYPNLTTLLAKQNPYTVEIPCRQLKHAIYQMQALVDNQITVVVKITLEEGKLIVETQKLETAEGRQEISIAYNEDSVPIGVNAKFLLDIISVLETAGEENLQMSFEGSLQPIIFSSSQWDNFISLLMPVKIKW